MSVACLLQYSHGYVSRSSMDERPRRLGHSPHKTNGRHSARPLLTAMISGREDYCTHGSTANLSHYFPESFCRQSNTIGGARKLNTGEVETPYHVTG